MTITTETILPTTVHGVPSGTYDGSSMDWYSVAVKAANYYRGRSGIQTVRFDVTGFVGDMTVEATLDSVAETATWFTISAYNASTPLTDIHPVSVIGNFTWLRINITDFDDGVINSVTVTY